MYEKLLKLTSDEDVQNLLKKYGIWDAAFLTKGKLEHRYKSVIRVMRHRAKKRQKAQEVLEANKNEDEKPH